MILPRCHEVSKRDAADLKNTASLMTKPPQLLNLASTSESVTVRFHRSLAHGSQDPCPEAHAAQVNNEEQE